MKTIQAYREGGLGDVILQHFKDDRIGALEEYKRANFPVYARLTLNCHNPAAAELFRYSAFDEVELVPYRPNAIGRYPIDYADLPHGAAPTSIGRTGGEDDRYLNAVPPDDFIVLHPFTDFGFALGRDDARRIADRHRTVLVGGCRDRSHPACIEHPNLTNLVGLANPRLVCAMLRRSIGFVGTMSCYCWAAACQGIPARVFRPIIENDPYLGIAARYGVRVVNRPEEL